MVFGVFVGVAALLTIFGIKPLGALLVWVMVLLVALCVWRWYLVPYVALTRDSVVVQGAFAHRSVRYSAIARALPSGAGLRIETRGEGVLTAWAIQKSKVSEWTHRETTADDVAAAIMERAGQAGGAE